MALEMKNECGRCHTELQDESVAFICVHECTFCPNCTEMMGATCPNCAGELVRRPRRKSQ
ncbi:DUF1272 domain-containing protein [bacterium AH-315-J21]|nr:DUF1272 domain-containing protein [bacterium AH-315-J21]